MINDDLVFVIEGKERIGMSCMGLSIFQIYQEVNKNDTKKTK